MRVCPRCNLRYQDETEHCFVDGAELEEVQDSRIGTVVAGRYLLESVLGSGGMATVYRARHELVDRLLAVKILHDNFADDEKLRERLSREAKSTAAIAHPNIVEIYDFGVTEDGVPYLVMEMLEGDPLNALLDRRQLAIPEVIDLGIQLGRGLARAHDLGVVHRDIKPENIFVCRSDDGHPVVKLVDFGIAVASSDERLTATGQLIGSPEFMSPERLLHGDVAPASDLYSVGCVLFRMVTGRLPFVSNNVAGYLIAHLEEAPADVRSLRPECPEELAQLVAELLAKKPEERPVDAHEVVTRLSRLGAPDASRVRKVSTLVQRKGGFDHASQLEDWAERVRTFDEMLWMAWPGGDAPDVLEERLAELRAGVGRLMALRKHALRDNAELEAAEERVQLDRERLGRAVHSVAEELSSMRSAQRASASGSAVEGEEAAVSAAFAQLQASLEQSPHAPTPQTLRAAEAFRDEYANWLAERQPGGEGDLVFQLDALRQQLTHREAEAAQARERSLARLEANSHERQELMGRLVVLGTELYGRLRPLPVLSDLFARLDRAG